MLCIDSLREFPESATVIGQANTPHAQPTIVQNHVLCGMEADLRRALIRHDDDLVLSV
jgi:hypothetical protein